jgi:hypothetical protein
VTTISSLSRKFSRSYFLCIGGTAATLALAAFVGNLSEFLHPDWRDSGAGDMIAVVSVFGIIGIIFLAVAFALDKEKGWAAPFAALVSFTLMILVPTEWAAPGFVGFVLLVGVPMTLTFIWAVSQMRLFQKNRWFTWVAVAGILLVVHLSLEFVAWASQPGNAAVTHGSPLPWAVASFPVFLLVGHDKAMLNLFWPAMATNSLIWSVALTLVAKWISERVRSFR